MKYTKTCECCGETFQTSQPRKQLCDKQHYKKCVVCGSEFPVNKRNWKTKKFCSRKCTEQWYRENGKYEEFAKKANETKKRKYYEKGITFNAPKHLRTCRICGKEFQPRNANQQICDRTHYKVCEVCGDLFEVTASTYKKQRTCSTECRYLLVKLTSLERYGVDNPAKSEQAKAKSRQTCEQRYGKPFALQSDSVKAKSRKTCLSKYGVPYSSQSAEVRQKMRETSRKKYGSDYFLSSQHGRQALRDYCYREYGTEFPTQSNKVKSRINKTCSEKYGVPWPCLASHVILSNVKNTSSYNLEFCKLLLEYNVDSSTEFVLEDRSFDVKVGNTLIEINPTCDHNVVTSPHGTKVSPSYHLNKSKLAEKYGYRCIHVWDWDDWEKVVNLVLPASRRLYARKCQVVELDKETTDKFLRDSHLQGTCKCQTVRLGLTHNDELVEIMTFGKPRYNRKFEWELIRLCTLPSTSVVGGPSKLFSHFVKKCNPKSVLSYCDRSKFTGKVYQSIGMTLADEGTPNKHWYSPRKSERMQHVTNNFLLQRGFDQIFGTSYGRGTNNEQLMLERGYLPVYDCGQMRFEWHK